MKIRETFEDDNRAVLHLFADGTISLEDVIMRLGGDMKLNSTRKRDFISSLRRIASALGASAKAIPADPQYLQQRLKGFAPAPPGLSKKTWSNIISDAKAALTRVGIVQKPASRSALAPQWQALFDQVVDQNMRCNLTRFVTFCSRTGVDPSQVNNDTMKDFMGLFSSLRKDPALAHYYVTRSWNRATMTVNGWPQIQLQVPSRRKIYTESPCDLPRSFNEDVERYFALMAGEDVLAEEAPPKPLRPASINQYRKQIYRFCGELIAAHVPATDIVSLRDLVRPDRVDTGLRHMLSRNGEKKSQNIFMMAYMLKNIAKHYCKLEQSDVKKLETMCDKLKMPYRGMTAKNRSRLRQFDDLANVSRILHLGDSLVGEAERLATHPKKAACLVEMALAIELLIITAIRIKNLAALHLNKNIQWQRATKQDCCHLVLEPYEVKNEEHIEVELPAATASLLSLFVRRYRPLLVPSQSPWLFGRRDRPDPVSTVVLANRIKRLIRDKTGLEVNPHLFRHLMGKLHLDARPGEYEIARRVLGHKSMATTVRAYTGAEAKAAYKLYDETLQKLRKAPLPKRSSSRLGYSNRGRS